ncbi:MULTISPECIES: cytochrome c oxidase subunit 3 [unclassified Rhizobium]|uniref:cytochrome c oxidase subunit 3 n=1 Tax=unclassified Rhizobium TaxID=2613769 RepID=UPI0006FADF46|nr:MULTISPECIES: cytochrome c oxidase subunit 3 [unclassified Rhizobium]KQV39946.1 NorE accessory protein for nitric oxide reductase [Rhizobium sp. Root1212]KRD31656.1 NorE accessory protein for nitric oxide reductase [Rhizobium sp. Root268]
MTAIVESGADERSDGDLILWILVWSELIAFGMLIGAFLVMSFLHPESYSIAKLHLNGRLASINTVVLIVSGWLAAEADRAASVRGRRVALIAAACLGFAFVAIKLVEYAGEIRFAGDATFNSFFELYFIITGFHLAHVIFLGFVMLLVARRAERSNVAMVATLWHVIDIVWLVVFPIIYLG